MRRLLTPHRIVVAASPAASGRGPAGTGGDLLDTAWDLHPQVAVRPEPFGALLYHFGTRRLSFLKDVRLTAAVRALADHPDARSACAATGLDPIPDDVTAALRTLATTGMIVRRDAP